MQVITKRAPPPGFAARKTAGEATDLEWLGLKPSQTPGRQAERTQQVCNASASELQMKPARIAVLYHRRVHASDEPLSSASAGVHACQAAPQLVR